MAKKVEIELNREAVRSQLLKSSAMMSICQSQAQNIAARCGSGYAVSAYSGTNRVNAMVYPETAEASKDNYRHNTILKAMG